MTEAQRSLDHMELTSKIVAGYISYNQVEQEKLSAFIQQVYHSLMSIQSDNSFKFSKSSGPTVSTEESIKPFPLFRRKNLPKNTKELS